MVTAIAEPIDNAVAFIISAAVTAVLAALTGGKIP